MCDTTEWYLMFDSVYELRWVYSYYVAYIDITGESIAVPIVF